jgi:hypothetical protein
MLGQGRSRIYNIVTIVFLALSLVTFLIVLLMLLSG